jgi:hypothetical protein
MSTKTKVGTGTIKTSGTNLRFKNNIHRVPRSIDSKLTPVSCHSHTH